MTHPTVLLASDRRTVYLAGVDPRGTASSRGALAIVSRDPATGGLTQLTGVKGCANGAGTQECGSAPCLNAYTALAVSPDGRRLYSGG